jgi:hypothetical protein
MYRILEKAFRFFCNAYSLLAVFLLLALSSIASAQTAETVTVQPLNIDWGSTASTLLTSLTSVAVVGIGVALSVWVLMMIVRLFRRTAG